MPGRRVTIGMVTAAQRRSTHGSFMGYMARSLQGAGADVRVIGPAFSPVHVAALAANGVARRILPRPCNFHDTWLQARDWARVLQGRLRGIDAVMGLHQAVEVAMLETRVPLVYASDATFDLVRDYYPQYSGLPAWSVRQAEAIEHRTLRRAALLTFPSAWAATSAREHYGVAPERIRIVPHGADIDELPPAERAISPRPRGRCELLFVGVDWQRKGGDIACDAAQTLRERGFDTRLTVVGCTPPRRVSGDLLRIVPHLDKQDPRQRALLSELYLQSHLLLLPTRAECFGRVFAEAAAHGLPSIATDTGGVPAAVHHGVTGHLLPPSADGHAYANVIAQLCNDADRHQAMVVASRRLYEERLNWDAWARAVLDAISELLGWGRRAGAAA